MTETSASGKLERRRGQLGYRYARMASNHLPPAGCWLRREGRVVDPSANAGPTLRGGDAVGVAAPRNPIERLEPSLTGTCHNRRPRRTPSIGALAGERLVLSDDYPLLHAMLGAAPVALTAQSLVAWWRSSLSEVLSPGVTGKVGVPTSPALG
jgi:hypothetical protein